jgi:RNA polymerase sigma-70 factor (ECF subfamily)
MALDLAAIVGEHTGFLLRGALSMGFAHTEAEELVQDTFAAFLQGKDRFEGRSSVRTFLYGILRNKAFALRRKQGREAAGSDDVEAEAAFGERFTPGGHWRAEEPKGPEDEALNDELAVLISACAEALPEQQRQAFFLKEAEGFSPEEICNALEVSGTHLRVLLFRARLRLRECLQRSWSRK